MTSRLRLSELPFLAATLGMALALALPWAFGGPGEEPEAEVAAILPWVATDPAPHAPDSVQLASRASVAPEDPARP